MSEQLIHIKVFYNPEYLNVWIGNSYRINDFIDDIKNTWIQGKYSYSHFFYHLENDCILQGDKTFEENYVVQGDHLILF